jgi:hypothetical protein
LGRLDMPMWSCTNSSDRPSRLSSHYLALAHRPAPHGPLVVSARHTKGKGGSSSHSHPHHLSPSSTNTISSSSSGSVPTSSSRAAPTSARTAALHPAAPVEPLQSPAHETSYPPPPDPRRPRGVQPSHGVPITLIASPPDPPAHAKRQQRKQGV